MRRVVQGLWRHTRLHFLDEPLSSKSADGPFPALRYALCNPVRPISWRPVNALVREGCRNLLSSFGGQSFRLPWLPGGCGRLFWFAPDGALQQQIF